MPPSYKREIELLSGFVRDLRRLPRAWWDLEGPPYWECEKIEASLHRRVPGVRAAVIRAGVDFAGPFGEDQAYDFLAHALDSKPRPNVLRVLEQAIGVFEHRLVPTVKPADQVAGAAAAPIEGERPQPEGKGVSVYQREIELLTVFATDLRRFHSIGPLVDKTLAKERDALRDALNRRVPAVRRAVERTEVPRHGVDMKSGRFDYLNLVLEKHVFDQVLTIIQQALGVYENDIVPEDLKRREEQEAERRRRERWLRDEEEKTKNGLALSGGGASAVIRDVSAVKLPGLEGAPSKRVVVRYLRDDGHYKAGQEVFSPLADVWPLAEAGVVEYVRDTLLPERDPAQFDKEFNEAFRAEVLNVVRDAPGGAPASDADPKEKPRRSLREHVEDHPLTYLFIVAVSAFSLGVAVGAWGRDGWDAAVARLNARAATNVRSPEGEQPPPPARWSP